jgi:oligopeptide/dipeptide ABC transporter ATP-binding protein
MTAPEMVSFKNVCKYFPITGGVFKREVGQLRILNGVDLSIRTGEILGLVGESGCGKSTLAKLMVKLMDVSSGEILFSGRPLPQIRGEEKTRFYQQVQMGFQDPYSSLNPRLRVGDIVGEMVRIRGRSKSSSALEVRRILSDVGLSEDVLDRYPHEFSGGQRQRIAIARALIVHPQLLIADEPVSALDLSIQAQVLDLLRALKEKYNLTILFISHDLETVAGLCDRAAVMYLGRIVEVIKAESLFQNGAHPYLKALLDSVPISDPSMRNRKRKLLTGEVPSPFDLPEGCPFHPRCPEAMDICRKEQPPLKELDDNGHLAACHLFPS